MTRCRLAGEQGSGIDPAAARVSEVRQALHHLRAHRRIPYMVVRRTDGGKFDRQKVLNGLLRACEKRPVPISKLEQIVNEAESFVIESQERERKTSELGELIMNRLRRYDKVAYVRFASVYLDFKDVNEFMNELRIW